MTTTNKIEVVTSDRTDNLLEQARSCQLCKDHLPFEPKPVVTGSASARLLIIGQAPGTRVQKSGIPWNDPSGDRLRQWLGLDREQFYDSQHIAIMPMGFCYPGKGKSGDLPPRPECAPQWHNKIIATMPNIQTTLLIGQYAQKYYLDGKLTLTERVRHWQDYAPEYWVMPHPSPRNNLWLRRHPWFEQKLVPQLKNHVSRVLGF
ncbi:Uracil-DNA glycosylase [Saliniradius amylolyticus]|uniref:Uracil-DNA glycosylase n=1 Tax=Saliniradius amylolyticus TaxID=2183582 RepID=A0A2S2E4B7_9ALTE|nr:uracil-DNA glycosylase family protein [Saliniradius amylolyticus]AWL12491.1 Uracil-DNA glycosylase [Saliniradius amylolyticus]